MSAEGVYLISSFYNDPSGAEIYTFPIIPNHSSVTLFIIQCSKAKIWTPQWVFYNVYNNVYYKITQA